MSITADLNLGPDGCLVLEQAILIYRAQHGEDRFGSSAVFASQHDVLEEAGSLRLAPGRNLTTAQVQALVEGFWRTKTSFIPEHVLAITPQVMAWWVPTQARALYFAATDPFLEQLSGHVFPQPTLVFIAARRRLQVFALEVNARPAPETRLFIAPYWNTMGGNVCLGSTALPDVLDPLETDRWVTGFFQSAFTHATNQILVNFEGSYGEFWQSLERESEFPNVALRPSGLTLAQALERC